MTKINQFMLPLTTALWASFIAICTIFMPWGAYEMAMRFAYPPIVFGDVVESQIGAPGFYSEIDVAGDRSGSLTRGCEVTVHWGLEDANKRYHSASSGTFTVRTQESLNESSDSIIPIQFFTPNRIKPGPAKFINDARYTCSLWDEIFGAQRVVFETLVNVPE